MDTANAVGSKSSRSSGGSNCVEVATNFVVSHGVVIVRDSKNPNGPVLTFAVGAWTAFVGSVRGTDDYDVPG